MVINSKFYKIAKLYSKLDTGDKTAHQLNSILMHKFVTSLSNCKPNIPVIIKEQLTSSLNSLNK